MSMKSQQKQFYDMWFRKRRRQKKKPYKRSENGNICTEEKINVQFYL